jgi:hypothetical protein
VTTGNRPITLPVHGAGRPAGTIRHGAIGPRPIHAAACRRCGAAVYDRPAFDEVALWLRDHLAVDHGIRVVTVDLGRLPGRHLHRRDPEAVKLVTRLAAVWGDDTARPSVASWRADRRAA